MGQQGSRVNRPGVGRGPNNTGQALAAGGTNAALLTQVPNHYPRTQIAHGNAAANSVASQQVPSAVHADPTNMARDQSAAAIAVNQQLVPALIRIKGEQVNKVLAQNQPGVKIRKESPNVSMELQIEENNVWKTYKMTQSQEEFFAIVMLCPGQKKFKFVKDGQSNARVDMIDATQPFEQGIPQFNVINVHPSSHSHQEDINSMDDLNWGQEIVIHQENRKLPPILPPHLRYTPLSAPPTQYRVDASGKLCPVSDSLALDPEHLPMPMSVSINHTYFQRREDHVVIGVTNRYRNKFTSIVYYRSVEKDTARRRLSV